MDPSNNATLAPLSSPLSHSLHTLWSSLWHATTVVASSLTTPVVLAFVIPAVLCVLIYLSALTMYLYYQRERIMQGVREAYEERDLYRAGVGMIALFWDALVGVMM